MFRAPSVLLVAFIVATAFTSPAVGRRISGGRHSYPSSRSGLSGHGRNSGGRHSYPSSQSGLSGHGTHSGGAHSEHTIHPQQSKPAYRPHPSNAGGHGMSQPHHTYNPPQQIHYTPVHGPPPVHPYPVYHGPPPVYVHEFRDSGSRFSTLLTGLALYNLGRSASRHHGSSAPVERRDDANGEKCALRIEQNRDIERIKIPCYIVATFTDKNDLNKTINTADSNTTSSTPVITPGVATITTNDTIHNTTISASTVINSTALNSTTSDNITTTVTQNVTETPMLTTTDGQNASTVIVALVDPLKVTDLNSKPFKLTQDARCFVERTTKTSSSSREIECGLLQQYALQSMQKQPRTRSAACCHSSQLSALTISCVIFLMVS